MQLKKVLVLSSEDLKNKGIMGEESTKKLLRLISVHQRKQSKKKKRKKR